MKKRKVQLTTGLLALSLALTSISPIAVMADSVPENLDYVLEKSEDIPEKDKEKNEDKLKGEQKSKVEEKESRKDQDKEAVDSELDLGSDDFSLDPINEDAEIKEKESPKKDGEREDHYTVPENMTDWEAGGQNIEDFIGSPSEGSNDIDNNFSNSEDIVDDFLQGDGDYTSEENIGYDEIPTIGTDVDTTTTPEPKPVKGSSNKGVDFDYFDARTKNRPRTSSSNDSFDDFGGQGESQSIKSMKTTRREFDTIQYTFDTTGDYPIYVDTGIEVPEDGKLSIEAMEEFLAQVSIQSNGKIVEDKDRILLILDGQPLIIKEGITTAYDLESIFNKGPIRVKVQKSRIGGRHNLAEELEVNGELRLIVDDEEVELTTNPSITNSEVLFPIRSIGDGMGADVTWDNNKREAVVVKGDTRMVFKLDSDIVIINGKDVKMALPTEVRAGENRILSLISILVEELGGEVEFDTNTGTLVIETEEFQKEIVD